VCISNNPRRTESDRRHYAARAEMFVELLKEKADAGQMLR